jgi:predicted ferric reductase
LCAPLGGIRLRIHGSRQGEVLKAADLGGEGGRSGPAEVWFCGPQGLAESLETGLRAIWRSRCRFHQEAFEMR